MLQPETKRTKQCVKSTRSYCKIALGFATCQTLARVLRRLVLTPGLLAPGEEEVEPKQAVVALSMLQPAVHELLSWAASLRQDPSPASSQSLS